MLLHTKNDIPFPINYQVKEIKLSCEKQIVRYTISGLEYKSAEQTKGAEWSLRQAGQQTCNAYSCLTFVNLI